MVKDVMFTPFKSNGCWFWFSQNFEYFHMTWWSQQILVTLGLDGLFVIKLWVSWGTMRNSIWNKSQLDHYPA